MFLFLSLIFSVGVLDVSSLNMGCEFCVKGSSFGGRGSDPVRGLNDGGGGCLEESSWGSSHSLAPFHALLLPSPVFHLSTVGNWFSLSPAVGFGIGGGQAWFSLSGLCSIMMLCASLEVVFGPFSGCFFPYFGWVCVEGQYAWWWSCCGTPWTSVGGVHGTGNRSWGSVGVSLGLVIDK